MEYINSVYEEEILRLIFLSLEIASALWVHIFFFETTLRAFVNRVMSKTFLDQNWLRIPNLLAQHERKTVQRALEHLRNKSLPPELLISELGFSFWIELCSARYYEKIWRRLEEANPRLIDQRRDFYNKAREIRNLRNSIAHHGPIMRRNLIRDHAYLDELTAILDPELAREVEKRSRVLDLLLNARLVGSGGGI
jgi:hypothetical protein